MCDNGFKLHLQNPKQEILVTNNNVLRRLRYIFDMDDNKVISLFGLGNLEVTREQISDWLKADDDEAYKSCHDVEMASFLNGLIIDKRGKREGPQPEPEKKLNNNIILRKLKIAFDLQADDILALLEAADVKISKHELSAFFRKMGHKHYRDCKDQILRNFLAGLQEKYRGDEQF